MYKISTGPDRTSFSVLLTETGSGGAWTKNVSALSSRPQEMPVQSVRVCVAEKAVCCSESLGSDGGKDLNNEEAGSGSDTIV